MTIQRYLFAMWESGGALPPQLGLCRQLIRRGHEVRVIGDPTIEPSARAEGCAFTPWTRAPSRTSLDPSQDPMKDWEARNPMEMLRRARDGMIAAPAADYAADVREAIRAHDIDVLLTDHHLAGAILGAQAEGVPIVAIVPNIWTLPTPGVPPVGPGFGPSTSPLARLRNRLLLAFVNRVFDGALPTINAAREANGLPPIERFYDQMTDVDRILVLSSPAFDFASPFVPPHVRYVGPVLDDPTWVDEWTPPWDGTAGDERPLVLVSLSSTFQDQVATLNRIVAALDMLPVRAIVTLGRNVDPSEVPARGDVHVVASAPHGPILDRADLVVTHGGHGTTMKALAAGIPIVCLPMGRDQNDNAARIAHLGVGVRRPHTSHPDKLASAMRTVLDDPSFGARARAFARTLAAERSEIDVVAEIERVAGASTLPA